MSKLVLVTGSGSGIGRATALAFAREGAQVVITDIDQARVDDAKGELGSACVLARKVDVGDRAAMTALAADVHAIGVLDVLVNNAGVAVGGGILDTTLEDWDWLMKVNLMGVVHGCHLFVPKMAARRSGHVVNISSMFGYFAPPGVAAYVASKHAVLGLSMSMRAELHDHGVGVSAICPGMIATNIIHGSRMNAELGTLRGKMADRFARRGAPPSKVANAILDAVKKDRAVVPVMPEAWLSWGLTRVSPRLSNRLGARIHGLVARRPG